MLHHVVTTEIRARGLRPGWNFSPAATLGSLIHLSGYPKRLSKGHSSQGKGWRGLGLWVAATSGCSLDPPPASCKLQGLETKF